MGTSTGKDSNCSITEIGMMALIPMENHKAMELIIGATDQCTKESSKTD